MRVSEFIEKKLTDLVRTHKSATVRYGYDSFSDTHIIEVSPVSLFESDEFAEWEANFYRESLKEYPDSDISFIPKNAAVPIEKIEFELDRASLAVDEDSQSVWMNTPNIYSAYPSPAL
jgi:hypothetical protein